MSLYSLLFFIFFYFPAQAVLAGPSGPRTADYSVTHLDIRDAILSLVSVLRDQMDKLERHEVRERQLGEQVTRALSILEKRSRGEEKNIESIAQYIARLDEKIKFIQTSIDKQSEDSRQQNEALRAEIATVSRSSQPSGSSGSGGQALEVKIDVIAQTVSQIEHATTVQAAKLDKLEEQIRESASSSATAAAAAVLSLERPVSNNNNNNNNTAVSTGGHELSESVIMTELAEIKESLARTLEVENQLLASRSNSAENTWQGEMMESMDSQRKQLAQLEEEISKAVGLLGDMTSSASTLQSVLGSLENDTKSGFQVLENQVDLLRSNSSENVDEKLSKVQDILRSGQKHIEGKVKEAEFAIETLFTKMETGYDQLSKELKGLSNVESVLLDTGDSVLDTKRRLEYGVQQIMGELNNQLTLHTAKLNESLQKRFDGLATAVLSNQSMALTNLTSRMEEDISQVWRQIGILYHTMSRSANLLDEIHSQTSKYVNNSLDTMSSMDGKVGAITYRMGEVDDNLNYLLGRMSLVVQEFNMIKGGLGNALQSLKESLKEVGGEGALPTNIPAEDGQDNEIVPHENNKTSNEES